MSTPNKAERTLPIRLSAGSAIARGLVVLLIGSVIVGVVLVVAWLLFSPFRPVPNEKQELAVTIPRAVSQAGDGGIVDMRTLVAFDWDRMYVFGAYTPDADVSQTLGFPWGSGDDLRLPNDGFVLLVFAKDREVTGWAVLNDYQSTGPVVGFNEGELKRPITRDRATFKATVRPDQTDTGRAIYGLTLVSALSGVT